MPRNPITTVRDLEGLREEVRLQLHLASAEARDQFDALEQRWTELRGRIDDTGASAETSIDQLGTALTMMASELGRSYQRIRDAVTGSGSTRV